MDKLFDRLGVYDLFGALIPGMTFSAFLFFVGFPIIKEGIYSLSQTFKVILFVLISYILGTLFQEIASFIDKRCTKLRTKPIEKIIEPKKSLFNGYELQEVQNFINKMLNKNETSNIPSNSECSMVFFKCKAFLENSNKMEKANKLDAIFAMSRDFIICNLCIFLCVIIIMIYREFNYTYLWIMIYTILSSAIFYYRAKRYSELRVKTILRQYINLQG